MNGIIIAAEMEGRTQHFYTLAPIELIQAKGLMSAAIVGTVDTPEAGEPLDRLMSRSFRGNSDFHDTIHSFLSGFVPGNPAFLNRAREQGGGWIYIIDQRTPSPGGDVPMEDIVGGFEIVDGRPATYWANPDHQLFNEKGLFDLGQELNEGFQQFLVGLFAENTHD